MSGLVWQKGCRPPRRRTSRELLLLSAAQASTTARPWSRPPRSQPATTTIMSLTETSNIRPCDCPPTLIAASRPCRPFRKRRGTHTSAPATAFWTSAVGITFDLRLQSPTLPPIYLRAPTRYRAGDASPERGLSELSTWRPTSRRRQSGSVADLPLRNLGARDSPLAAQPWLDLAISVRAYAEVNVQGATPLSAFLARVPGARAVRLTPALVTIPLLKFLILSLPLSRRRRLPRVLRLRPLSRIITTGTPASRARPPFSRPPAPPPRLPPATPPRPPPTLYPRLRPLPRQLLTWTAL